MIDYKSNLFLLKPTSDRGLDLLRYCRQSELFYLGIYIGNLLIVMFPHNEHIYDELGICYYYTQQYKKSSEIYEKIMNNFPHMDYKQIQHFQSNARFSYQYLNNTYLEYPSTLINKISNRKKEQFPQITFTITTCKRLNLFKNTMNSFINCCTDLHLIDKWICVDDNSSSNDRKEMMELYPFFNFYFKKPEEKGHAKSLNIIQNLIKTPYIFHIEDDWYFFRETNYLTQCRNILDTDHTLGQCLVNKNYIETEKDLNRIVGGIHKVTKSGTIYFEHEFCPDEESKTKFRSKYGNYLVNCNYWAHFSLRPSLLKSDVFESVGLFDELANHFEMDYSYRYVAKNYKSAFLNGIYCKHIGRLTTERFNSNQLNAYDLNNEPQFKSITKPKELNIKSFVINLDRRPDRFENFKKQIESFSDLQITRFSAYDGKLLNNTLQLSRLFAGNDYKMRRGMVGCALSHIHLYIDLVNSEDDVYIIFEDDITFSPKFENKLWYIFKQLKELDWDLLYLGHHIYDQYKTPETNVPELEKWNRLRSLTQSRGGTGGYIITKKGALKLLDFINKYGMTNGIDTVQQKSADYLNIYYLTSHLIFSECYDGKKLIDTDIQFDFDNLEITLEDLVKNEIDYYSQKNIKVNIKEFNNLNPNDIYYFLDDKWTCSFSPEQITKEIENERQFHRLKYYDTNLKDYKYHLNNKGLYK